MFANQADNKASLDRAREVVRKAIAELGDKSIPMRQISVYLDQWNKRNFQTQGGNVGGWAPFKYGGRVTYKNGKREINTSAKLLQDTGSLRMSFLPFASENTAGIGSDLPYSKHHEEGTRNIPQRRMLPKIDEVSDRIELIFNNFVKAKLDEVST